MRQAIPRALGRPLAAALLGAAVAGCNPIARLAGEDAALRPAPRPAEAAIRLDSDVEAPEVFAVEAEALWDGRPSLGGIWIASPDARDPERVLMRNVETDETVVGALFRRERITPGPPLQLSSEAAVALGILAGAPTRVAVVALRQRDEPAAEVAEAPADAAAPTP